jgi:ABC-type branched-subunit amino acid transport system ATPase component
MTSAIMATGLRKSFGGTAGTTFSLPDPNGAGKTTPMQHVRNLLENAARPREADGTVGVRGRTSSTATSPSTAPDSFRHWRRRATMTISQSRPAIAATALRRLASAIERAGGEGTGSEGASR